MPRHAVIILDGGVSSRLEETVGRPLHPQLWSAGEVLTAEGRAAIVVSIKTAPYHNKYTSHPTDVSFLLPGYAHRVDVAAVADFIHEAIDEILRYT